MSIVISTAELADTIRTGRKNTLLASFWTEILGNGINLFRSQHIPTSLYCDPAAALAGIPGSAHGRNPLPSAEVLNRWFPRWGINSDREVIVYDEGHGVFAARTWWILRWAGVDNVRILDGGFSKWEEEDRGHAGGPGNFPRFCNVRANPGQLPTADIDQVKKFNGLLIDARDSNRFAGRRELLDLKAGHIPGAINIPASAMTHPDHTFRDPAELRSIFEKYGVTDGSNVIVYSGSGNHSALVIAAMHHAGIEGAAHYVGGWSQWSANPNNPVERGE